MPTLENVVVQLEARLDQLEADLRKGVSKAEQAGQEAGSEFANRFGRSLGGVQRSLMGALEAVGGMLAGSQIFRGLDQMALSANEAEVNLRRLAKAAQSGGYDLNEVNASVERISKTLRVNREDVAGYLAQWLNMNAGLRESEQALIAVGASTLNMGRGAKAGLDAATASFMSGTSIALQFAGVSSNVGAALAEAEKKMAGASDQALGLARSQAFYNAIARETRSDVATVDTIFRGYGGTLNNLEQAQIRLNRELGKAFLPIIADLKSGLASLIEVFAQLPEPVQKFAVAVAALSGAILGGSGLYRALQVLQPAMVALFATPGGMFLVGLSALTALAYSSGWIKLRKEMDATADSAASLAKQGIAAQLAPLQARLTELQQVRQLVSESAAPQSKSDPRYTERMNRLNAEIDALERTIAAINKQLAGLNNLPTGGNTVTTLGAPALSPALVAEAKKYLLAEQNAKTGVDYDRAVQASKNFADQSELNARAMAAARYELTLAAKALKEQHQGSRAALREWANQPEMVNRAGFPGNRFESLGLDSNLGNYYVSGGATALIAQRQKELAAQEEAAAAAVAANWLRATWVAAQKEQARMLATQGKLTPDFSVGGQTANPGKLEELQTERDALYDLLATAKEYRQTSFLDEKILDREREWNDLLQVQLATEERLNERIQERNQEWADAALNAEADLELRKRLAQAYKDIADLTDEQARRGVGVAQVLSDTEKAANLLEGANLDSLASVNYLIDAFRQLGLTALPVFDHLVARAEQLKREMDASAQAAREAMELFRQGERNPDASLVQEGRNTMDLYGKDEGRFAGVQSGATGKTASLLEVLGGLLQPFSQLGQIVNSINPVMALVSRLLQALQPAIETLLTPITILAGAIAQALLPVFKALFPVVKLFAMVLTVVLLGIAKAWNALAWIIDKVTLGMVKLYIDTKPLEDAFGTLTNLTWDQAEKYKDLNKQLNDAANNLPTGYKIALARFNATSPVSPFPWPFPGSGALPPWLGGGINATPATVNVQIVSNDPETIWRRLEPYLIRQSYIRSGRIARSV